MPSSSSPFGGRKTMTQSWGSRDPSRTIGQRGGATKPSRGRRRFDTFTTWKRYSMRALTLTRTARWSCTTYPSLSASCRRRRSGSCHSPLPAIGVSCLTRLMVSKGVSTVSWCLGGMRGTCVSLTSTLSSGGMSGLISTSTRAGAASAPSSSSSSSTRSSTQTSTKSTSQSSSLTCSPRTGTTSSVITTLLLVFTLCPIRTAMRNRSRRRAT
mmetsp:Transcript_2895/g.6943  ORF Transcript_2895/g.6943 Transcript_2895/m.6943 type:complete len:212 (+) Transcript_2895:1469-2104(+)